MMPFYLHSFHLFEQTLLEHPLRLVLDNFMGNKDDFMHTQGNKIAGDGGKDLPNCFKCSKVLVGTR